MHAMTLKSIMSTDFLSYVDTLTVKEALYQLKTIDRSSTSPNVYVVNTDNRLVGSLSFKELATSDQHAPISDIMSSTCLSLRLHEDLDKVSKQIKETNDVAIPIINESNHMIGVVTTNDLRRTLEVDADFALSPLAGAGKRAPWLILLMIVGLLTGGVIKHFEQALESVVLLAIFIPLVMGSAGNIGTQSLAIVVRGLSLETFSRKAITRMLKKQLGTGNLTGLACGLVITLLIPLLPYFGGSWLIGSIVGVAIFLSLSITCLIGCYSPFNSLSV